MLPVLAVLLVLVVSVPAGADTLAVTGEARWAGECTLRWQASALDRVTRVDLSLPLPQTQQGWGWNFLPAAPQVRIDPAPFWQDQGRDRLQVQWHHKGPQAMVEVRFAFQMTTQVLPLNASAPYPLEGVPAEVGRFTGASPWVQPREVAAAVAQVVRGAGSAVQALVDVAAWLRSRCRYQPETNMESSHQVWQQGFGGMVGLTHLWIAALRGAGIPARAVVGVDASGEISVAAPAETLPRAPGLSVWLEAWLPEHGWVALDPRGMVGFLLPGRIPLVAAEDVPAALEGAAVRWRHVAGVAVSPRWGLEATVSALPSGKSPVAHRQPARIPCGCLLWSRGTVPLPPGSSSRPRPRPCVLRPLPWNSQGAMAQVRLSMPKPWRLFRGFLCVWSMLSPTAAGPWPSQWRGLCGLGPWNCPCAACAVAAKCGWRLQPMRMALQERLWRCPGPWQALPLAPRCAGSVSPCPLWTSALGATGLCPNFLEIFRPYGF
jgi:enamine deaminase RidA (YjgF/YER057c/UK114 family)